MNKLSAYWQSLRTSDRIFNTSYIVMLLMTALLPFTTYLMWPIGILLMLLWMAQGKWREKWSDFKANDGIPYGLFLLGICLIPLLGLFNSDHQNYAWRTVECYLWFLIAPLVILTTSRNLLTKKHIHLILAVFSSSVLLHILVLFIRGFFMAITTGDNTYLFYSTFSFLRHPSYVAMYTTFAYVLIFVYSFENKDVLSKSKKAVLSIANMVLLISIFCLYSRAGIITFIFTQLALSIYAVHRRRSEWKWMLFTFMLITGLFIILLATPIAPINRFTETNYSTEQEVSGSKQRDARLVLWQSAWEESIENLPFGTGTGDCFEAIRENYNAKGYWVDFNHNYNAHNQYLQCLLTNGIPGIILLLLYLFTPLGESIRHKDFLLFSLFILLAMNSCVECVFDRRFGVDFFAIMIPMMMMRAMDCHETSNT